MNWLVVICSCLEGAVCVHHAPQCPCCCSPFSLIDGHNSSPWLLTGYLKASPLRTRPDTAAIISPMYFLSPGFTMSQVARVTLP